MYLLRLFNLAYGCWLEELIVLVVWSVLGVRLIGKNGRRWNYFC